MTDTITAGVQPVFRQFASDNYAGICPEAWRAMERAYNDVQALISAVQAAAGR